MSEGYLILSRRRGESIIIDGDIKVTILDTRGNQTRVGIQAPKEVEILREELIGDKDEDSL
jgi:carbon storage regulator